MEAITLQQRKENLINRIQQLDAEGVAEWERMMEAEVIGTPSTLEEYNATIDRAVERAKAGQSLSHEEVLAQLEALRK